MTNISQSLQIAWPWIHDGSNMSKMIFFSAKNRYFLFHHCRPFLWLYSNWNALERLNFFDKMIINFLLKFVWVWEEKFHSAQKIKVTVNIAKTVPFDATQMFFLLLVINLLRNWSELKLIRFVLSFDGLHFKQRALEFPQYSWYVTLVVQDSGRHNIVIERYKAAAVLEL